jgi:hypothetical protein
VPCVLELEARQLLATSAQATAADIAFVTNLYQSILFREPNAADVEIWTRVLERGASERAVARAFLHSRERVGLVTALGVDLRGRPRPFVESLFTSLLGRAPNAIGERFWVGVVRSGADRERVVQDFLNGSEFPGVATSLELAVAPTATTHGDAVALTARLVPGAGLLPATGTVEFFSGATHIATAAVSGFTAKATTTALSAGDDAITAVYQGDGHYRQSASAPVSVTVARAGTTTALTASPNPAPPGSPVELTAAVSPATGSETPGGTVEFFAGGASLGSGMLSGGKAVLTTSMIPLGINQVTAVYAGSADFTSSTAPAVSVAVGDVTTTSLTALPPTSTYTDTVEMTATVTATSGGPVTGQVEFFDGATSLGTADVDHGEAVFDIDVLTGGVHSLKAVYLGDGTHLPSNSAPASVTIFQAAAQVSLSASETDVADGEPVTFTVFVLSSTGNGIPSGGVTFYDGTTELGTRTLPGVPGQEAVLTTSSLSHGTRSITARYGGDINFGPGTSAPVTVDVGVIGTTTSLDASPEFNFSGIPVELTATVTPDSGTGTPSGSVEFFAGTTFLGRASVGGIFGNTARLSTPAIPVGAQGVTAVYGGDDDFGSSTSAPVLVDIFQSPSLTIIEESVAGITPGSSVTFTAFLRLFPFIGNNANKATGTVTFFDGSTELGTVTLDDKESAELTTSALTTLGLHLISAVYSGDTNFLGSTSFPTTISVVNTTSTTVLEVVPASSTYGDAVQIKATVTPAAGAGTSTPTGTVTFFDGEDQLENPVELSNGVAVAPFALIPAGNHSLRAVYSGDSTYASSTSSVAPLSIARLATTSTVSVSTSSSPFGDGVEITADVTTSNSLVAPLIGTVEFYAGATLLGTWQLDDGSATLFATNIPLGKDIPLTAVYVGDGNFQPSTSQAVPITITQAPTVTTLAASPTSANPGDPVTLTATVTNVGVTLIPGGSVDFYDGSTLIGSAPISDTTAEAKLVVTTLTTGSHSLTAVYPGSTDFLTSTSSAVTVDIEDDL